MPRSPRRPARSVSSSAAKQRLLKSHVCSGAPELALRLRGFRLIAGVDEVGRGCLFGPVVAAAVILPECVDELARAGLRDSKQLTHLQRESLDRLIRATALAISIAEIDAATIDRVNIYQATRLAMLSAVRALTIAPDHLLIDAMQLDLSGLAHPCAQTKLIHGDALSLSIAAASVVAKVHRDRLLSALDAAHPGYGLAAHKGYATAQHLRALTLLGPTPLHRQSFAPVKACTHPLLHATPTPTQTTTHPTTASFQTTGNF
jgi:ribonuclease HII